MHRLEPVRVASALLGVTSFLAASAPADEQVVDIETVGAQDRMAIWEEAAKADGYAEVTAAVPNFGNKALWPTLTGREAFVVQEWPKPARTLVWAHPGESGAVYPRPTPRDPTDPKNWREDGRPCETFVLDEQTDLVLPPSETPYVVNFREGPVREVVRHVTVGAGATFAGVSRAVRGNIWVKRGGSIGCHGSTNFVGERHTFFRNDNDTGLDSQYYTFNKEQPELSVEFLGRTATLDEWKLFRGTVIVGAESTMLPGRNAQPFVEKEGTLVLMDNAFWGKWQIEFAEALDLEVKGKLLGGLPERPLTRNAYVGLSIRNWKPVDFSSVEDPDGKHALTDKRVCSLMARSGAVLRTHAAPGSEARLVITRRPKFFGREKSREWFGQLGYLGQIRPGPCIKGRMRKSKYREDAKFRQMFESLRWKTVIFVDADVTIDNVLLDHIGPGGIATPDPDAFRARKSITYGPNLLCDPAELPTRVDKLRPKSRGGYGY